MRLIRREPLGDGTVAAVYQEGSDEVWMVNEEVKDVDQVVDALNNILDRLNEDDPPARGHWRVLRRMIRPVCRRVHVH